MLIAALTNRFLILINPLLYNVASTLLFASDSFILTVLLLFVKQIEAQPREQQLGFNAVVLLLVYPATLAAAMLHWSRVSEAEVS